MNTPADSHDGRARRHSAHSRRRTVAGVFVCGLLAIVMPGCKFNFGPALLGSGLSKTESRDVAPFTAIEVSNAIQLDVVIGPEKNLTVTTDDNILSHVTTTVSDGRLRIDVDQSCSSRIGIKVAASTPELQVLHGSGASTATVSRVKADHFQLELSGASRCELVVEAETLEAHLSGASQATLTGSSHELKIDCSGASQCNATDLAAKTVAAHLSGASNAKVNAGEKLGIHASGASTLRYSGHPADVTKELSGASTVTDE